MLSVRWMSSILGARALPRAPLADQSYKYAKSSTTLRLKVNLTAALASSSLGRMVLRRHVDEDTRGLLAVLTDFANAVAGKKKAKLYEKVGTCPCLCVRRRCERDLAAGDGGAWARPVVP